MWLSWLALFCGDWNFFLVMLRNDCASMTSTGDTVSPDRSTHLASCACVIHALPIGTQVEMVEPFRLVPSSQPAMPFHFVYPASLCHCAMTATRLENPTIGNDNSGCI